MTTSKRKADSESLRSSNPKKSRVKDVTPLFHSDLFKQASVRGIANEYAHNGPYPHAVVKELIRDNLLRQVRHEIDNISFTPKETDIYRIKQSGDLANLDGLHEDDLKHFPNVLELRNALYSSKFRAWVSEVTGVGKLSGSKTDMAVNVYEPGCYLLCHDDFISTRTVSYILYLTDPDDPWDSAWGGALRLYSTTAHHNKAGKLVNVPHTDSIKNIAPSSAQLSFFAVLPGESYHDVEEVYFGENEEDNKRRRRIAVSGWFHLPQEGEDGYDEAVNKAQEEASKAARIESESNEFDRPQTIFRHFDQPRKVANAQATGTEVDPGDKKDKNAKILTEQDLTFLIKYISPGFLVPDKLDQLSEAFLKTSQLELDQFLSKKFAKELRKYIEEAEAPKADAADVDKSSKTGETQEESVNDNDSPASWETAGPTHKQRFTYLQKDTTSQIIATSSPISKLLVDLIHSHAFKKWLALATALKSSSLTRQHALARRFRKGNDYALGSRYKKEHPQLEFTISMTPSTGWTREDSGSPPPTNGKSRAKSDKDKKKKKEKKASSKATQKEGVATNGGEEVYLADETFEDGNGDTKSALPSVGKKDAYDPAVYQAAQDDNDDILLDIPPKWNVFNVVLRDANTFRCVNYVSRSAKGDRWDIKGEIELSSDAFDDEEEEDENEDDISNRMSDLDMTDVEDVEDGKDDDNNGPAGDGDEEAETDHDLDEGDVLDEDEEWVSGSAAAHQDEDEEEDDSLSPRPSKRRKTGKK